jgi:hypothetical protein
MIFRTSLFTLLLLLTPCGVAESSVRNSSATGPAIATTGQALTIVNGPWRFHIGDDARWADPGFDDSAWELYTIDPIHVPLNAPEVLDAAPLPGWQGHGHSGYVGYAWYRISVDHASDGTPLAILMPQYVDDAYEIYVNGKQIGAFVNSRGIALCTLHVQSFFPSRPE